MTTPSSHSSLSPASSYESPPPLPVDLVPRPPQTPSENASQHSESISISSASSYASTVCLVPTSPRINQLPAICNPRDYPSLFLPHLFRPLAVENPSRRFKAPRLPPASKSPIPGSPPPWMLAKKRSYDAATRGTTRSSKLVALAGKRKSSEPLGKGRATKWRKRVLAQRGEAKEVEMAGMWRRVF
jgi:hypothetical protein